MSEPEFTYTRIQPSIERSPEPVEREWLVIILSEAIVKVLEEYAVRDGSAQIPMPTGVTYRIEANP